ncbi:hypothetical protein LCGC14_0289220 [marine sediment metagenome]|uniref:Uncharacterized protein n=1 Tax=marine sediment metagenome TaxID=412755 RepID=A0A0F9TTT8_9ZZZZ
MGNAGFGDSGAPTEGEVTPQAKAEVTDGIQGSQAASSAFQKEEEVAPVDDGLVAYVAAKEFANSRFLVVHGVPVKAPIAAGGSVGITPLITREGDVWAKFVNSVLVTNDQKVIEWCDAHTKICRRSDDPMTKSWVTVKALQARLANRERLLDTSEMDADESFPPGLVGSLQAQAAQPRSAGNTAVDNAEAAKESLQQNRAAGQ